MKTCTITFQPGGQQAAVPEGTDLLTAAIVADVQLYNSCGGEGVCRECKVIVREGRVASELTERLSEQEREAGYRLACCTTALGDVVVEVPPESRIEWEQILTEGTEGERRDGAFDLVSDTTKGLELERRAPAAPSPLVRKAFVSLPPPSLDDNISDLQRLYREVGRQLDVGEVSTGLANVRKLGRILREGNWQITVTLGEADGRTEILQIEPGDSTDRCFGVVVDVGTTTVVVSLVDLTAGAILGTKGTQNRQIRYGQDVITRIVYAEKPDGLSALHEAVVDTINGLISVLATEHGIPLTDVVLCTLGGNTTMTHLLLRIDPYYLRRDPYVPMASSIPVSRAIDAGIRINPRGWMACLPCVASYVGGDITAGVLAAGIDEAEHPALLIDLGTNGEIALGNREWLVCSSASAGPAFEGSGVKCGVRSVRGAIQGVTIDPVSLAAELVTIEDASPVGICGSGYIELLSELFFSGLTDRQGALQPDKGGDRVREGENGLEFVLVPVDQTATDWDIVITQADIENLIRAKGSIYSAAKVLLNRLGMTAEEIDRVYIGGGLGNNLNVEKAIMIGLLPDLPPERYAFIGNSSLAGARMALLSQEAMGKAEVIADRMMNIELCSEQAYMSEYVSSLFLPHTDIDLFPTVKRRLGV